MGPVTGARLVASVVVLVVVACMGSSLAQAPPQSEKAAAESLFQAAMALIKEGKIAEACPKLADSQRMDPAPGTLLNLAWCHETEGKTASAWAEYKESAALAETAGRADHAAKARAAADRLEPKLSRLRVEAPSAAPGLIVHRDGVEIGAGSLGVDVAVDPGEHTVVASAPGFAPWSTRVTLLAGGNERTVTIPALEPLPAPPPPPATPVPSATPSQVAAPSPSPPPPAGSDTRRLIGFATAGFGVAAIAVGAGFGLSAASDFSDAEGDPALCPGKVCSPEGRSLVDDGEDKAAISTVAFAVGLAAVAAGVVLVLTSRGSSAGRGGGGGRLRASAGHRRGMFAGEAAF